MPKPQTGILPEASTNAVFITLNLAAPDQLNALRNWLKTIPVKTEALARHFADAQLISVVALGVGIWHELHATSPAELAEFRARELGHRKSPATPSDVLLHIRSNRRDINHELARELTSSSAAFLEISEEIHGFRYLESRDLTGFVDGTENPEGPERAEVALIGSEDPEFESGSYVLLQRYVHDLKRFHQLPVTEQEAIIGRTKADDIEMDAETKPPTAHISRVVIKQDGEEMEILRHSLPYGNSQRAGLMFIAYCAHRRNFDLMLDRMFDVKAEGLHDHLLDYTQAETGAFYFAPSIKVIERL